MNTHKALADDRFPWEDEEPAGDDSEDEKQSAAGTVENADETPVARGTVTHANDEPPSLFDQTDYAVESESGNTPATTRPVAHKEYYSISEVCDLVGLKPHVLRYWETQFQVLNPSKNRSGNRVYQRKEIKLILLVKHLLYEEKYTVEGAKAKLDQMRRGGRLQEGMVRALDQQMIDMLRAELNQLSRILASPGSQ